MGNYTLGTNCCRAGEDLKNGRSLDWDRFGEGHTLRMVDARLGAAGLWLVAAGAVGLACDDGAALEPGVQMVGGTSASASAGETSTDTAAAGARDQSGVAGGSGNPGTEAEGGAGGASGEGGSANGGNAGIGGAETIPEGPRPIRALQITSGSYHSCALLENHQVKCWGDNGYGQLGVGDLDDRGLLPEQMGDALPYVDLGTDRSVKQITSARYTTCAILDDDSVKCWGLNIMDRPSMDGQVGDAAGEMGDNLATVQIGEGHTAKWAAMGYGESCIVREDDSLYCGGTSELNHHDLAPPQGTQLVQVAGTGGVLTLDDAGVVHSSWGDLVASGVKAMVANDGVQCFQRQDLSVACNDQPIPGNLAPRISFDTLAVAEQSHGFCGLYAEGQILCSGGAQDEAWIARTGETYTVAIDTPAVALSGGQQHFCSLLMSGAVACWGIYDQFTPAIGFDIPGATEIQVVDLGTWNP